ncbi:hypothetical protein HI914_06669 [Erysiphe necator]|nr:hypothetical protein HI914_06669 [Erysiphe necator]
MALSAHRWITTKKSDNIVEIIFLSNSDIQDLVPSISNEYDVSVGYTKSYHLNEEISFVVSKTAVLTDSMSHQFYDDGAYNHTENDIDPNFNLCAIFNMPHVTTEN